MQASTKQVAKYIGIFRPTFIGRKIDSYFVVLPMVFYQIVPKLQNIEVLLCFKTKMKGCSRYRKHSISLLA